MRTTLVCTTACALALAVHNAPAQSLLVADATNRRLLLLDAGSGAVLDRTYVDLSRGAAKHPVEAFVAGSELWVTDQDGDKVLRYSLDGTSFLGVVAGGLDDVRGAAFVEGHAFVANGGSTAVSPGDVLMMFSATTAFLGSFQVPKPTDVLVYRGDLLVPDETTGTIARYTTGGWFVDAFHASRGGKELQQPRQIASDGSGRVIAAGGGTTSGVYVFDSNGEEVAVWHTPNAVNGVARLGDGKYLFTDAEGIHAIDPESGAITHLMTGFEAEFVTPFTGTPDPIASYCSGDGSRLDHTSMCPCMNFGATGHGCANSVGLDGARLSASGSPAQDDVVLRAESEPATAFTMFLQHDALGDTVFHDGILCASGNLVRLRGRAAALGTVEFPDSLRAEDATITLAQRGGVLPGSGARRYYAAWYRNASSFFCAPATSNVSNGIRIDW